MSKKRNDKGNQCESKDDSPQSKEKRSKNSNDKEEGEFGCGEINEAYVDEECQESDGHEDESEGDEDLSDEDEEEFDVNKVYGTKISYMYLKIEDLRNELFVNINDGVLKFSESENLKHWKLLLLDEDLSPEKLNFGHDSLHCEQPILTPAFGHYNNEEEGIEVNEDEDIEVNDLEDDGENYRNDFLNDDENVDDDDQGKDVEQGNTSGFNEEDVINLNSIVGNVVKSVGLVDGFEGDVNVIQEGNENLVWCGINQKAAEDDMNEILTGTINLGDDYKNKEGISYDTVNKVIGEKKKDDESIAPSLVKGCAKGECLNDKAKKDGQGVVEGEGGEVGTDSENRVEDDSNKNKDRGVETISGIPIVSPDYLEYSYDPDVHQCYLKAVGDQN
ncbi:unnamed protein product [Lactuca virosa]|uniref:Uncharacterized protein n=1 Tax=Lactuca virosa TaxID=75947 RepID=A0AAU9NRA7_9ASTR|nr:unnamed protein product [Lactuca virosa]